MITYKRKQVQAVVFDWAGTTVDYGCMAPVAAVVSAFRDSGIELEVAEARRPMGLAKRQHIKAVCCVDRVRREWYAKYGRDLDVNDANRLYKGFESAILQILPDFSKPIPGVTELIGRLRERCLKIGSTTGYTAGMARVVADSAARRGYVPDILVASSDVPAGRPRPWMCYHNAIALGVYPLSTMVKVGDTVLDIEEGLNAGMWTVGVVQGGSLMGWTEAGVAEADTESLREATERVRQVFSEAGAHFVIDRIGDLDSVLETIDERLEQGACPECVRK